MNPYTIDAPETLLRSVRLQQPDRIEQTFCIGGVAEVTLAVQADIPREEAQAALDAALPDILERAKRYNLRIEIVRTYEGATVVHTAAERWRG